MYVVPSPSATWAVQTELQLLTLIRCSTAVIVLLPLDALKAWRSILYLACMPLIPATTLSFLSSCSELCGLRADFLFADDENFPALPSRRPAAPPGLSRVVSVRNSIDLGTRSSTPKLPPGLNISHAHPSPAEQKDTPTEQEIAKVASSIPGPVVPAVPLLPKGQCVELSKPKASEVDEKKLPAALEMATGSTTEETKDASVAALDISLGSPKPKRAQSKIEGKNETVHQIERVSDPVDRQKENSEVKGNVETKAIKRTGPERIAIPPTKTQSTSDSTQSETATVFPADVVATPSLISSQPSTPATPSRANARPLVMRVMTGTTKPADATPASATTEKSSGMPPLSLERHLSRRPSISSISHTRSSTPAMSDAFSFGASRASSPPPGIIGSAPERTKTKAQQRKDRKEKAKQSVESEQASGATTPVIVEEVAPVISRQRKQKKRVESSADSGIQSQASEDTDKPVTANKKKGETSASSKLRGSDADTKPPAKPKRQDSVKSSAPPTPREESKPSPLIHEPPAPKWTLRDLYNYTAKHPEADIQTLLNTYVSSTAEILAPLLTNHDIDMTNPLFNPPPLSSYRLPTDSRRGADYLDANGYTDSNPFGMLYLTQDKKRAIQNGHAVRISDASKPADLLRRAMVSPTGTVWRHLNEGEEERVLELEERREVYAEEYGGMGLGIMDRLTVLEEGDYMNLEGGMERLARGGEACGVSWVIRDEEEDGDEGDEDDEEELGEEEYDDEEEEEDEDLTDDEDLGLNVPGGWETGLALGTVPENVHITNKANMLPPMRLVPGGEGEIGKRNLRGMDVAGLVERIREAQREVEAARREVEKVEKSVGRKNKEAGRWREASLKLSSVH